MTQMNPDTGVLLTTEEQMEHPPSIFVGAPNMSLPVYGITKNDREGVRCFKSIGAFYKYLREHPQAPVPNVAETEGVDKIIAELDKIDKERMALEKKYKTKYDKAQANWKWPTDRPLRVWGYTTLFSSVMQWQMRGLLKGCELNGCETKFFQEDTSTSRVAYSSRLGRVSTPLMKDVMEFKPDIILCINWYRMPEIYGTKIPHYTWVQDRLRNLNEDFAKAVRPNDFIGLLTKGWLDKWLMSKFPREQLSSHPAGYDSSIFGPPETPTKREGIVYVEQNGALTPEQKWAELTNQYAGYLKAEPKLGPIMGTFFARCKEAFDMGCDLHEYEYEAIWADICAEAGAQFPSVFRRQFLWQFLHGVGTRWMRQRPLLELARANAPLKLYGADWEKHPILAPFAAGPTQPLSELAKIYQNAQVVLGLQHESSMVHRVVEGLACGAHVAVKYLRCDFEQAATHVAVSQWGGPGEVVPLMSSLLNTPPPPREATNIDKFSMKAQMEVILGGIGERMKQLEGEK